MEKHICRVCSRSFSSGRALGGHMKGHLAALPLPPKVTHKQLGRQNESPPSSLSSSSSEEDGPEDKNGQELEEKSGVYGLRENPKKSFKLADPEFSFAADTGSVVQDRESETESKNPTRQRSKRNRKQRRVESASSGSDTTQDEAVAICLMMLSRDAWKSGNGVEEVKMVKKARKFGKEVHEKDRIFECPFCFRVFGSGQALGGHKRSHLLGFFSSSSSNLKIYGQNLLDLNLPAQPEEDEFSVLSEA